MPTMELTDYEAALIIQCRLPWEDRLAAIRAETAAMVLQTTEILGEVDPLQIED